MPVYCLKLEFDIVCGDVLRAVLRNHAPAWRATANKVNVRMLGAIGQRDWSGRTRVENMVRLGLSD